MDVKLTLQSHSGQVKLMHVERVFFQNNFYKSFALYCIFDFLDVCLATYLRRYSCRDCKYIYKDH